MQEMLNSLGDSSQCPVALIIKDGKILLGHRHYTVDTWKTLSVWTCPGGRCDAGETIEETLRREVKEEIAVEALLIKEYLGEFPGAKEPDVVPVFLCSIADEPKNMEPDKFSDWQWFAKADFPDTFINKDVAQLIATIL